MTKSWWGFAGWNALAATAIGFAGQAVAAPEQAGAVWAGTLASFAGALAGSVPLAREIDAPTGKSATVIGRATLLRLAVTLAGGAVAALAGGFERRTLLFALAVAYLGLLAVETGWFLRKARKERSTI
jgi:hypothetical protein